MMRGQQDQQSRMPYDLSTLVLNILRSSPAVAPISLPDHPSALPPSRLSPSLSQITNAGFASLLLGISVSLMLCGSVTFDRTESSRSQLEQSKKITSSELQTIKNYDGALLGKTQSHKLINANFDAQLTEDEIKEARHKVLALEMELENKNHGCEELKGRCLELQLLLESMKKESSNHDTNQKEKPMRTNPLYQPS